MGVRLAALVVYRSRAGALGAGKEQGKVAVRPKADADRPRLSFSFFPRARVFWRVGEWRESCGMRGRGYDIAGTVM